MGHLQLRWVGQFGQSEFLIFGRYAQKTLSSGEYPFQSSQTTGFGPFELLTRGLLQKGQDHSLPKFCMLCEEPSFLVSTTILMGIHSAMNILIIINWGWGQWVELL